MKPTIMYNADGDHVVSVYTLFNNTYAESANSESWRSGALKKGSLSIRANVESGNLVCTFALAARQNPLRDFIVVDSYAFPSGPAGSAFTKEYDFDGMNALEWLP